MKRPVLCLAMLLFLPPAVATADDTTELEALLHEQVVSTATQTSEAASAAPALSTSIRADDLRRYGIRSLDEAVNFLSLGLVTNKDQNFAEIGARGVLINNDFAVHVLVLVDGHMMNEEWGGVVYPDRGLGIPLEIVDHIEVIVGPGSVLYGSHAMSGVINVVTKRARDYAGFHSLLETEHRTLAPISGRIGLGYGGEFSLFGKRGDVVAIGEYYRRHGPAVTFDKQYYAPVDADGNPVPVRFAPNGEPGVWGPVAQRSWDVRAPSLFARARLGDVEAMLRGSLYQRQQPDAGPGLATDMPFDDPRSFERDQWLSADIKYHRTVSELLDVRTRVYGDYYKYLWQPEAYDPSQCWGASPSGCKLRVLGEALWGGVAVDGTLDWLHDARLVTLAGAEGRLRSYTGIQDEVSRDTGVNAAYVPSYQHTEGLLGVFVEQIIRPLRARPLPPLTLNLGARLDADHRFGTALSPRAAVVAQAWRGGALKAIYSEAFRAPTAYELYYSAPTTQVQADALRPEKVRSVEALAEQRFGTHKLLFGVFRSWWDDLVAPHYLSEAEITAATAQGKLSDAADVGQVNQSRNIAHIDNWGFNGGFEGWKLGGSLRYAFNVTGAYSRLDTGEGGSVLLQASPSLFGNARISYDLPGVLPTVALATRMTGRQQARGDFKPPAYAPTQVELRLTVTGDVPGVKGLSYRAMGNYATASRDPYAIGPTRKGSPDEAHLLPVEHFEGLLGLSYDVP